MKTGTVCLLACLALFAWPALGAQADANHFTLDAGFGGASEGHGTLKVLLGAERPFRVESRGQRLADGTFRLDQTVRFQGKAATRRHWLLRTVQPGAYAGTLSDAAGRVTGHTLGARLLLRYRLKGPLVMHQTLELMPDGTIDNVGKITFLGVSVGHLYETIERRSHEPQ